MAIFHKLSFLFVFCFSSLILANTNIFSNRNLLINDQQWFFQNTDLENTFMLVSPSIETPKRKLYIQTEKDDTASSVFPDLTDFMVLSEEIHEDEWVKVTKTLAFSKTSSEQSKPDYILLKARYATHYSNKFIVVSLVSKPTCQKCMETTLKWVDILQNAYLNDEETALVINQDYEIPIAYTVQENACLASDQTSNVKEQDIFYIVADYLSSARTWAAASASALVAVGWFYGKIILGVLGLYSCPRTGSQFCCCANNS